MRLRIGRGKPDAATFSAPKTDHRRWPGETRTWASTAGTGTAEPRSTTWQCSGGYGPLERQLGRLSVGNRLAETEFGGKDVGPGSRRTWGHQVAYLGELFC